MEEVVRLHSSTRHCILHIHIILLLLLLLLLFQNILMVVVDNDVREIRILKTVWHRASIRTKQSV